MATVLRFAQCQSSVDITFWSELSDRKLDQYKLSEEPVDIQGMEPCVHACLNCN